MRLGKALLSGPHEGEGMETVQILITRQVTSTLPYLFSPSWQPKRFAPVTARTKKEIGNKVKVGRYLGFSCL